MNLLSRRQKRADPRLESVEIGDRMEFIYDLLVENELFLRSQDIMLCIPIAAEIKQKALSRRIIRGV